MQSVFLEWMLFYSADTWHSVIVSVRVMLMRLANEKCN